MKHKTSFGLMFVSRIVITLVLLFVALPVVGARSPESASVVETQDALSAADGVPGARFVHTATDANISGNSTYIDHPLTNDNPSAIVLVTQNWNPGGVGATYNNHPIGVYYSGGEQKWAVFNQDFANMPTGAAFNVLIPATDADAFVHTATAANLNENWTYIDHPLTNGNRNAIVLVTQNWNPGGVGATYNDHPIGVWYDGAESKWAVFNQDLAAMPTGAGFNVLIPPTGADVFVHSATAANLAGNSTYIDHPLANGNPNAIVLVTQNWNPGGVGTYNNHPTGVWYYGWAKKWAVFNQDLAAMPSGADFNVLVATTDSAAFIHSATAANIYGNSTYIDHPLTNDNPSAIVLVTPNWNPGGVGNTYNDHPIGVWYSSVAKKWAIFNQDGASMPDGAAFNVLIPSVDTSVFVHMARAGNITGNWTYIDHPLTNGDPNAIVFVTQNWNPSGMGPTYNGHPIGVWYDDWEGKWAVFNQDDTSSMPDGAAFNVLVSSADTEVFVHTATAANIAGNWTYIDHALTNGTPNAIVLVTQNWNPGGVGGTYNDHPIGVWYSSSAKKWAVFNQDNTSSMPDGAAFNVIVIVYKVYLPLVLRGT